ncbi:MAG: FecR domain-containing protein [Proteobacteria bacterium]|nr:FecR domain-containing protein [Pseudomonadota bacterium]
MATETGPSGGENTGNAVLLEAAAGEPVTLPGGFSLADAEFNHSGDDLVLKAPDGAQVTIRNFFAGDEPPDLMTPDGARISGALADRLAGPLAPGQVAEAGTDLGGEAIGIVNSISGKAFVIRIDGSRVALAVDTPLFTGDILETGPDGVIGVILADETTFAMGEEGRMVLDEMIYDPDTQEGSLSLSILKGIYTIVSGLVSKTDPNAMTIETPIATIGIRGTQIGLEFTDGENLTLVMMREADGYVGEVFIKNDGGLQVMNQAHQVMFIGGMDQIPIFKESVDDAGVIRIFQVTLSHLPTAHGRENDYRTQEAASGGVDDFDVLVDALLHGGFDVLYQFHLAAEFFGVAHRLEMDVSPLEHSERDALALPVRGDFVAHSHRRTGEFCLLVDGGDYFHADSQTSQVRLAALKRQAHLVEAQ